MNILVLEDRGSVSCYLEEALRQISHQVFSAFNILDAQTYWETERIDCIILDSNMRTDGLNAKETERADDGLLTGVIWLLERVFKKSNEMKQRTIIYTDYAERIMERVSRKDLQGVCLLSKKGLPSPAQGLLQEVCRIERILRL
jgi:DNA-binding response OmpR family regulator